MSSATKKKRQSPSTDQQLREALRRIYERYGNDLGAFFRDREKEQTGRSQPAKQKKLA